MITIPLDEYQALRHTAKQLIDIHPKPKRSHQGWRYLEPDDAPVDLGEGETGEVDCIGSGEVRVGLIDPLRSPDLP
ncbi:DUF1489 family protein [Novosphingobium sp.]|uniref:DUF1489 family protein n=1 Tax=Novosphingobium sp. TaxID=1874826 RepID=UPI00261E2B97|nr:DUF1489 family protein [Novosphingobium sp.]